VLRTVRWLAIIALISVILLDSALPLGVVGSLAQYPAVPTGAEYSIAQPAIALLCLLTGLFALAPAVERRQFRWFAAILVSLVVGGYGPLGVYALLSALVAANYQPNTNPSSSSLLTNGAIVSALSASVVPAIPAAVALLYTFRAGPPPAAAPPSNTAPPAPATPTDTPQNT
jgi:hypothetical protein